MDTAVPAEHGASDLDAGFDTLGTSGHQKMNTHRNGGANKAGRLAHPALSVLILTAIGTCTGAVLDAVMPAATQADASLSGLALPDWVGLVSLEHSAFTSGLPKLLALNATVAKNETLTAVFARAGAPSEQAVQAFAAMRPFLDPRLVRPGYQFKISMDEGLDGKTSLAGFSVKHGVDRSLYVHRTADGSYEARELLATLDAEVHVVRAKVTTTLYEAALAAGAGDQQVVDFADVFAYDIDFQREIWEGDEFEFVFERKSDERGNFVTGGPLLYARLTNRSLNKGFYRFTPSDDGVVDYFDSEGKSARRFLMKTPINGARLSSGFGMRRHPILGFNKLHKGTDFAAPTGTPIFAAGNGVVVKAEWNGGYGKFVRIRHPNGWETAYAHLSRYASGLSKGDRVRQGDVIGYVGSTGRSTGPHLHYEVFENGKNVNPMTIRLPTGRQLEGAILNEFMVWRDEVERLRNEWQQPMPPNALVASVSPDTGATGLAP
jgi:murein DD-endopeptidase MepM/ murein hydrolase activator NlpD